MLLPAALLPLLLILLLSAVPVLGSEPAAPGILAGEDALNLRCLHEAYPALRGLEADSLGRQWLLFEDGRRVLYREAPQAHTPAVLPEGADVAASMAAPYPLEPARPPTPPGVAPGRLRPYGQGTQSRCDS